MHFHLHLKFFCHIQSTPHHCSATLIHVLYYLKSLPLQIYSCNSTVLVWLPCHMLSRNRQRRNAAPSDLRCTSLLTAPRQIMYLLYLSWNRTVFTNIHFCPESSFDDSFPQLNSVVHQLDSSIILYSFTSSILLEQLHINLVLKNGQSSFAQASFHLWEFYDQPGQRATCPWYFHTSTGMSSAPTAFLFFILFSDFLTSPLLA